MRARAELLHSIEHYDVWRNIYRDDVYVHDYDVYVYVYVHPDGCPRACASDDVYVLDDDFAYDVYVLDDDVAYDVYVLDDDVAYDVYILDYDVCVYLHDGFSYDGVNNDDRRNDDDKLFVYPYGQHADSQCESDERFARRSPWPQHPGLAVEHQRLRRVARKARTDCGLLHRWRAGRLGAGRGAVVVARDSL